MKWSYGTSYLAHIVLCMLIVAAYRLASGAVVRIGGADVLIYSTMGLMYEVIRWRINTNGYKESAA